jgi:hypothetical protein
METSNQMIEAKLKGSGFVLTIETEESVGYRSGLKSEALRAVYINLERRTIEYELIRKGAPSRHWLERFETIEQLAEQLPGSAPSFDLKFQGLSPEDSGAAVRMASRPTITSEATEDPWDLTNYHAGPGREKPRQSTRLRIADVDLPM